MKAIIMAGGEGTRLRPISANKPKPMVELLDRPVLEHILELLKKHGVGSACLTLKYLPQMITDYFGGGERFGMHLEFRTETEALGTAGGVLNCADFIGDEDFIVISGDCVCDFDLGALMDFHARKKAEVTLALYSHPEPCEYGLVVTGEDGRVTRFIEKPAWDHVLTDQINTGIYVMRPSVLKEIPKGEPYDFGKDLFPRLLSARRGMYGYGASGYWCDVGSIGAYIKCCQDMLRGEIKADMGAAPVREGVWSAAAMPEGAVIVPPVYIGAGAVIDKGAEIGPFAVIGASSVIAAGAAVRHAVVNGAVVNENAAVTGAVVCRGASIGRGSEVREGAVVGDNCLVGDNCVVAANARLWPDRQIASGTLVTGSVSNGLLRGGLSFTKPGTVCGELGVTVTAEACLRLGEAAGDFKRVGIGWRGGEGARVMAEAFGCGVCAAGGDIIRHDGNFLSCASYAGQAFTLPLTLFVEEQKDDVSISFFGEGGGRIARDIERKFEAALSEPHKTSPRLTGSATTVMGVVDAYVSAAARAAQVPSGSGGALTVAVAGKGTENRALKSALALIGCEISDRKNGLIVMEASGGGMTLTAADEEGYHLTDDQLRVLSAFVEFSCGARELAVPYDAPAAIDALAGDFDAAVLRVGRDGRQAADLYLKQTALRDGVFAGVRLCAFLKSRGETLSGLRRKMPKFSSMTREIALKGDRGAVMRLMTSRCAGMASELASGLRLDTDRGCVYISPLRERSALKIRTESMSEEIAEELCAEFERRAREIDKG
ncbi:mannose-1-phosphate guanylyltransferase / phosphomannomutase [Sporobacter termitidis DSM 10068]|uniref:Mannose-1-phosphate guanylyltransferase / phosphomannomutase n=1 Tax=Sporobacter termitidis DSM 10068 TaxID=1123282 RepID=A0A1M5Y6K1_9FIRM|nr:sugar phosphate nucleotidyltransferase [Sporobacter termitidis]SHI07539.1 mannose-1-phosphate guanylyltransferase / phosphomannomutase [Sporobacter termitidis DSM 10068]